MAKKQETKKCRKTTLPPELRQLRLDLGGKSFIDPEEDARRDAEAHDVAIDCLLEQHRMEERVQECLSGLVCLAAEGYLSHGMVVDTLMGVVEAAFYAGARAADAERKPARSRK